MPEKPASDLPRPDDVAELVRRWVDAAATAPIDRDAERLDLLLQDPRGFDFAATIVDRVIRPEDPRVAARNLERLSRKLPQHLPRALRAAVLAGGGFGVVLPQPITPVTRAVFRRMVRHLVVENTPKTLEKALASTGDDDARIDVRLLGDAPLGEQQAAAHLAELLELLDRSDVDGVTLRLAEVVAPRSPWGFDEAVALLVERLEPLFQRADRGRAKSITLEVVEFRDLDLTLAVFTRLLSKGEFATLAAGIALPATLPDSLPALDRLTAWTRERVQAGGAGIRIRLTPGDRTGLERVDAALHGRPLATWGTRAEADAHLLRLLARALRPENAEVVRVGLASHDPFALAFAHLLADRRELSDRLVLEPTLGIASPLIDTVRPEFGGAAIATPVVAPERFEDAVPYLVRRLEESAALPDLEDGDAFGAAVERHARAFVALGDGIPETFRTQDRSHATVPTVPEPFANEPDTDPALPGNRAWAREVLGRAEDSTLGYATLREANVGDPERMRELVRETAAAGTAWSARPGSGRAEFLDRAGEVLAAFRGRLVEVLVADVACTFGDADAEVSRAVDLAFYSAARARELAGIRGAVFEPTPLVVVAPSRVLPLATAAGDVLAALAAGSAVLLTPAVGAARVAAVLAEALWEAGVPRDVLVLVDPSDAVARELVTAPEVGRVLLTGSIETAERYRSWRADLPVLGSTDGVNSVVVTPSADLDRTVEHLVEGAFGRGGRSCAAVSVAILVGSVGASDDFRAKLADAVTSLAVGAASDPTTQIGPFPTPPDGRAARALTKLAEGEGWLVKPRALDETDRLWSPGVREGVRPGSDAQRVEHLAPVLSLVAVPTLDDAIRLQNASDFGLAAGLESLDADEIATWLDRVEAGSLHVNRPLSTGAARRHPFGGWKDSAVGPHTATGGPNTLLALGSWRSEPSEPSDDLTLEGLDARVRATIEAFQPALDFAGFDRVRRAAFSDEEAWVGEFGRGHDPSALGVERNVFRYRPAEVVVRLSEGADIASLARVLVAGVRAKSRMLVSTSVPLPSGMLPLVDDGTPLGRSPLGLLGVQVEDDAAFRARVARGMPARIRLIGGDPVDLAHATGGSPEVAVWAGEVTGAGRIELLPFLREQSVSITAHRYGIPDREINALVL